MKFKHEKRISLMLIFLIILSSLSFAIHEDKSDEEVIQMMMNQGYDEYIIKNIFDYYYLNPHVYREQQKIVYSANSSYSDLRSSLPENQPSSSNLDSKGEYRYLGYNSNGDVVSNGKFTPDVDPYNGTLSSRNWITSSSALKSWKVFNMSPEIKDYMLNLAVVEVTENVGTDTILNILGGVSETTALNYAILQTMPGVRADGSIKMFHKTNTGNILYWILKIPSLNGNIDNTISVTAPAPADLTADVGENVSINYDLYHTLKLKTTNNIISDMGGLVESVNEKIIIKVNGTQLKTDSATLDVPLDGKINRTNSLIIPSSSLNEGINTVTIEGFNTFTSFLNDNKSTEVKDNDSFKIIVAEAGVPTPSLTVEAEPSSIKKNGSTTDVEITLNAVLGGLDKNPVAWKFRLNGEQKVVIGNGTKKATYVFTKTVDSSSVDTITWSGEVDIYPSNITDFVTASDSATTEIYDGTPPAPFNSRPTAYIDAPSIVVMGEEINIKVAVNDREDPISALDIDYGYPGNMIGGLSVGDNTVRFTQEGTFTVSVDVEDTGGKTVSCEDTIWVVPPTPVAKLDIYGNEKVNRKIKLTGVNSMGSENYPIDWTKTELKIIPLEGQNMNNVYIMSGGSIVNNIDTFTGYQTLYIQTTELGKFDIKLTVTNTIGYSGYQTKEIDIQPDILPTAKILTPEKVYRDPTNDNKQTTKIFNVSVSEDNDTFDKAVYIKQVDSDNDGNYNEETVEVYDGANWQQLPYNLSEVNNHKYELMNIYAINTTEVENVTLVVGKTRYNLIIAEDYEDRIHSLLNANDYIFTTIGNGDQKITNVDNMAPVANINIKSDNSQTIDLVVMTDYEGIELLTLKNQLSNLLSEMVEYQKTMNIHYITDKNHVSGTQTLTKTENLYARTVLARYHKVGHEQLCGTSADRDEDVDEWVDINMNLEEMYSLTTPSNNDFEFGTNIEYRTYSDRDEEHNKYTDYIKKYYAVESYDTGNIIDSRQTQKAYYYQEYESHTPYSNWCYLYRYDTTTVRNSITVDTNNANHWSLTGSTREVEITTDLNSFKLTDIEELNLSEDTQKVLLIVTQGSKYNDFTLQNGLEYSFSGLTNEDLFEVIDNNFDIFVVAPESVLDWKFNNNQYNSTVSTQNITLRNVAETGKYGGIIGDITTNLNYLKGNDNSNLISSIEINNTMIKFSFSEELDKYDEVKLSILDDVVLEDGSILETKDYRGIKEYEGNLFPLENGVYLARIDENRQYYEMGSLSDEVNHFVYKVFNDNSTIFNYDEIADNWSTTSSISIEAQSNQFIYFAEVNTSNQIKRLTIKEVN